MSKIAVIGGGPAGVMAAVTASKNNLNEIFIFEKNGILNTLLPTGGGRCNLANAQYNFKELAKFYPRGEKFLYSVFSGFSTNDTLQFFEKLGVKTYTQEDGRIFPVSNSSLEVKNALLKEIDKHKNIKKAFEKVLEIKKENDFFTVTTNKKSYKFDKVIIATGGKGSGQKFAKHLGHNIVELRPALCSLITMENFSDISGITLKNIKADVFFKNKKINNLNGDILFTHKGVSGPLIYKVSSYHAYVDFDKVNPLVVSLNLVNKDFGQFDKEFLEVLKKNPQKEAANVFSEFLPKNLATKIFEIENINPKTKSGQLTKQNRTALSQKAVNFVVNITGRSKGEEIVMAGGVDLKEINPKTLESKLVKGLYFCGEVMDIDGLTGGFNLQNCWSSGFRAGLTE